MKGVTHYQREILMLVRAVRAKTGQTADFDQVLDGLSWGPTKESAQFIIRALITKGFMQKLPLESRRGRKRVCYQLTPAGAGLLDPMVETGTEPKSEKVDEEVIPGSVVADKADLDIPGIEEEIAFASESLEP